MNTAALQSTFKKLVADNALYIDFVGLFESELEEIASVAAAGYDAAFDHNFVNGFRSLLRVNQKMLPREESRLGDTTGCFGSFRSLSFYCCALESFLLLVVLKPNFNNLAFLQDVVAEIRKVIKIK